MKKANRIFKIIGLKSISTDKVCFIIPDKELICSIYVDDF
jgi:hypothetical protein